MRAIDVRFAGSGADRYLVVVIDDGRLIVTPLSWYPTLAAASPEARGEWRIQGNGRGIQWPQLDLDLSVAGMMAGSKLRDLEKSDELADKLFNEP